MRPLFDNPRKELERLERELRAVEEEPTLEETYEDPEDALEEMKAFLAEEDWEESRREPLYRRYSAEPEEDAPPRPEKPGPVPAERKRKRNGGLIVILLLETVALLGVIGWWLRWLM